MGKKISLPLLSDVLARSPKGPSKQGKSEPGPSVHLARARLGGRATPTTNGSSAVSGEGPAASAPRAGIGISVGQIVACPARGGSIKPAAVIFASSTEVHVLLEGMRLRRLRPEEVAPYVDEVGSDLMKIAADARVFGVLSEGQPVRYANEAGVLLGGKLVEKCRYGALILRDDGAIVAVGFRKLWPAAGAGQA